MPLTAAANNNTKRLSKAPTNNNNNNNKNGDGASPGAGDLPTDVIDDNTTGNLPYEEEET